MDKKEILKDGYKLALTNEEIIPWDIYEDESSFNLWKEDDFITYIVMNKNDNGIAIASDTACNTPNGIINIHKLFYDRNSKIIIGVSGRSIIKQGEHLLHITKIFEDNVSYYDVNNYPLFLNHIILNVQNFLNSIQTENIETSHLLIIRIDNEIIVEDYMISNKTKEIISKYSPLNKNLFSIGITSTDDNINNRCETNAGLSLNELKNKSNLIVERKIKSTYLPYINGNIEWITMDNKGNIETNIS